MTVSGSHEWRTIASMSTRRSSVGVGVLQVRIGIVMVVIVLTDVTDVTAVMSQ